MYCRYARVTNRGCNCVSGEALVRCENETRIAELEMRSDVAKANSLVESAGVFVKQSACNSTSCIDYVEPNLCRYATPIDRQWIGLHTQCTIIECRSPEAKNSLTCFKDKNGVEYPAVRKPCDENYNLLPNADYLHVRSRFCNELWCPFYTNQQ